MGGKNGETQFDEHELATWLLSRMSEFATGVGVACWEELPFHLHFKNKLEPSEIRREIMVAVLYATQLFLEEHLGIDVSQRIVTAVIRGGFKTKCLQGDIGKYNTLSELLENRFSRYVKARQDPVATDETVRRVMMGVLAACSLGFDDEARAKFAEHVAAHLMCWVNEQKRDIAY